MQAQRPSPPNVPLLAGHVKKLVSRFGEPVMQDEGMPSRLLPLVAVFVLAIAPAASAATRTEASTAGQVTATFTYDYKKTSFGSYDFSKLHLTIDRAGVRLLDQDV